MIRFHQLEDIQCCLSPLNIVTVSLFVFLAPRSGLAAKHFIDVGGDVFTFNSTNLCIVVA